MKLNLHLHLPTTAMSSRTSKLKSPQWLQSSLSSSHFKSVLNILRDREYQRQHLRSESRDLPSSSQHRRRASQSSNSDQIAEAIDYYSVAVGCENGHCNRYSDVEPYDRTRVIVVGGERYLNANWVRELFGGRWWIATQAPLPETAHAFLSLIMQPVTRPPSSLDPSPTPSSSSQATASRIRTIVQLTQDIESGRRKADEYFPASAGEGHSFAIEAEEGADLGPLTVTLLKTEKIAEAHCVKSTVQISSAQGGVEPVVFTHMLYAAWPDHGVPEPEDRASLLAFLQLVDKTNDPSSPIMVNCSAGIGRTGSFIALSSLLRSHNLFASSSDTPSPLPPSPLGPLPSAFDSDLVAREVDALREQRPGMVQRDEQIHLIYEVLAAAF